MMKTLDIETKSVTDVKKDLSKIIKEANETGDPTYIFNHNKPEAVILSHTAYEELVRKQKELEDKLFYAQLAARIQEGPGNLFPQKKSLKEKKRR